MYINVHVCDNLLGLELVVFPHSALDDLAVATFQRALSVPLVLFPHSLVLSSICIGHGSFAFHKVVVISA